MPSKPPKPPSKIEVLMKAQTNEQKHLLSLEVERLMVEDLHRTITYYVSKYKVSFNVKLGMNEDDIMNDIRLQIYKGLLMRTEGGPANRKTYMDHVIKNRFSTLSQRITRNKYAATEYYGVVDASVIGDADSQERTVDNNTGEYLLQRRQEFVMNNKVIEHDPLQVKIIQGLLAGLSVSEMAAIHKLPAHMIIAKIKEINARLEERNRNTT